jgi:hypothetical protein
MPYPDNFSGHAMDAALGSPAHYRREATAARRAGEMLATDIATAERVQRLAVLMRAELANAEFRVASPLRGYDMEDILGTLSDWSQIDPDFVSDNEDHARNLARQEIWL